MLNPITKYQEDSQFTFFWSGPFSNFHICEFLRIGNQSYNCTEQYYMAQKALFFKDYESYNKIMLETNPKEQKNIARGVKNFDINKWNKVCKDIMFDGNLAKYTQNQELQTLLLDTFPTILVEASPFDKIWGIGLGEEEAKKTHYMKWNGKNWLGFILTNVRVHIMNTKLIYKSLEQV